jgi:hypothetical protein
MANLVATTITGDLTVDTDTLYVDTTNNRVGVGTASPQQLLEIENLTGDAQLNITADETSQSILALGDENNQYVQHIVSDHSDNSLRFHTAAAQGTNERMRIDSSGDVGIGTGSPSAKLTIEDGDFASLDLNLSNATGTTIADVRGLVTGTEKWRIGKTSSTSDNFAIDVTGTQRMQIAASNGNVKLASGVVHGAGGGINISAFRLLPTDGNGALNDNANDLGGPSNRFDDVYATSGTVNASDENEKQSIQSLTASEMAVAKRISKLFKTYKWNSAVEEKGDNARTHTGIIAQDVQQAFSDEGLDASNYGMFCSDTWWEKEISVDAVTPQEAVYETQTDEEGNEIQVLVQEAVEGKDAYTYIDTKEEATEGYTERTRLGIRYPELLSFVSSAFEQRLTNIETRLTALEA